jgi:HSP20 family protein
MKNLMITPNRAAREIDRMFDDFFRSPFLRTDVDTDFMPRVNVVDTRDNMLITFEVPGMEKKDIKVMVKDNVLTVSGERKFEHNEKEDTFIRNEIYAGSFSRSFTLPETVNPDKIQADYKNGMLEIRLGKLEEVKPKEIEVKIS